MQVTPPQLLAGAAAAARAGSHALSADSMAMLRMVCIATGFALHVVPTFTIREVYKAGSTMNYHISTYAFALLNQSVNLWYALIRNDVALISHRLLGVIFNAFYVYTFLHYCSPSKLPEFRRTLSRAAMLFIVVFVDLHVFLPVAGMTASYFNHIAFFGAMTGIGLAAGPLATISEVFRTRDASSLPFPFLSMVTVQCVSWTIYGYLQEDASTYWNNLVGVFLGGIQLILIFALPSKRPSGVSISGAGEKKAERESIGGGTSGAGGVGDEGADEDEAGPGASGGGEGSSLLLKSVSGGGGGGNAAVGGSLGSTGSGGGGSGNLGSSGPSSQSSSASAAQLKTSVGASGLLGHGPAGAGGSAHVTR